VHLVTVIDTRGCTGERTIGAQIAQAVAHVLKQTGSPNLIPFTANGMQPRLTHRVQVVQAIVCNVPWYEDLAIVWMRVLRTTRPGARPNSA
jgi:hypothetical protein